MKYRFLISVVAIVMIIAAAVITNLAMDQNSSGARPNADRASPPQGATASETSASTRNPVRATAQSATTASLPMDPATMKVGDNPDYPTLESRLLEMQARRENQTFTAEQVFAAMQAPSAWQSDDSVSEQVDLPDEDRFDGRTFIRFNALKVETLMPGDTMDIPIDQANRVFEMVVDEVEDHRDGTITWRGHLQDFQEENQVMITQSDGMTYAGVFTPDVPYTIEARGDAGWVVSSGTLFKGEDEPLSTPAP